MKEVPMPINFHDLIRCYRSIDVRVHDPYIFKFLRLCDAATEGETV
jgi:hypothetical protein